MARITVDDAQAWSEKTKLRIEQLDSGLLAQVETRVLARLSAAYPEDAATWVSATTTPDIVKNVIAMLYVAWFYDRQYSEEQESLNDYAILLRAEATTLMDGIIDGSLVIPGVQVPVADGPSFYPDDASTSMCPTSDDRSLGPEKFSMGQIF